MLSEGGFGGRWSRTGHLIRSAKRWGGALLWAQHVKRMRAKRRHAVLDPRRLVFVDPNALTEYYSHATIAKSANSLGMLRLSVGTVSGGDWDLEPSRLHDLRVFAAVHARVHGAEWHETQLPEVVARRPRFAGLGAEAVGSYLDKVDRMIEAIRSRGYKSQRELRSGRPWDEVLVAVARTGEIRFVDGRHRLAIAQALSLPSIPVLVTLRHSDWVDLVLSAHRGMPLPAWTPPRHPDLDGFRTC